MRRVMFWDDNRCVKVVMLAGFDTDECLKMAHFYYVNLPNDEQFKYTDIQVDPFDYGRIDVSKSYKEFGSSLLKAIKWLDDNDFEATLTSYNTDRAVFRVYRNGTEDELTLTNAVLNPTKVKILDYMEQFLKSFKLKQEIERLKAEKAAHDAAKEV